MLLPDWAHEGPLYQGKMCGKMFGQLVLGKSRVNPRQARVSDMFQKARVREGSVKRSVKEKGFG